MACWRIHACIAMPAAVPALIDRVEPNCATDTTSETASRAAGESPGPSWPSSSAQARGSRVDSSGTEPGRLSTPTTGSEAAAAQSANAFLAAEVHIVGNRRWNRRGAMVTDRYQHLRHHASVADLAAYLHERDVTLLGIDNLPGSAHLETMEIPRSVCFLFGQEGPGLSDPAREACDGTFSIAQFGSTRSINASAAAAIAMHAWIRTYADLSPDSDAWRG